MATGYIGSVIYDGPSRYTGERIVAIATLKSINTKSGSVIQIWILDASTDPINSVKMGLDAVVCGTCPFRAGAGCYVNIGRGPLGVYRAWQRGRYVTGREGWRKLKAAARLVGGVRWGAYGDPAAIPRSIAEPMFRAFNAIVGPRRQLAYTHGHATAPWLKKWAMASAQSPTESAKLRADGWRTFTLRRGTDPIQQGEVMCPASAEAGKRLTCTSCWACHGNPAGRGASISIVLHGPTPQLKKARETMDLIQIN